MGNEMDATMLINWGTMFRMPMGTDPAGVITGKIHLLAAELSQAASRGSRLAEECTGLKDEIITLKATKKRGGSERRKAVSEEIRDCICGSMFDYDLDKRVEKLEAKAKEECELCKQGRAEAARLTRGRDAVRLGLGLEELDPFCVGPCPHFGKEKQDAEM